MKYNLQLKSVQTKNQVSSSVILVTYINKQRFRASLGLSVPVHSWDRKKQQIKTNGANDLIALQDELNISVNSIVSLHTQLTVSPDIDLTLHAFKDAVKRMKEGKAGVAEKVLTFNQWVDEFIKESERGERTNQRGLPISFRTVQKYRTVEKQLNAFAKEVWGRQIRFDEIDGVFLNKYKKFRLDQGLGANSIAKDQAVVKTWLKESCNRGVHNNRHWESQAFKVKEIKVRKPTLTIEELKKLTKADFSGKNRYGVEKTAISKCRDHFIIACWTGLRISDTKRIPDIIADAWKQNGNKCPEFLTFIQEKTNSQVTLPVFPALSNIIKKYKGDIPALSASQQINKNIKIACEVAGLNRIIESPSTTAKEKGIKRIPLFEMVTNHTAKRTFATIIYKMGILSNGEIMSLTGHTSEGVFLRYLDVDKATESKLAGEKVMKALRGL